MEEIADWLERYQLSKYLDVFIENAIDVDVLTELTDADLKEFGIPFGDRKRILNAVPGSARTAVPQQPEASSPIYAQSVSGAKAGEAEFRQITLAFCDLVGSTALSESMSAEQYRQQIIEYRQLSAQAIRQYDGYIAQTMGDGLFIYFGYPQAHEDDAERAVRACLTIVDNIESFNASTGSQLKVRIGIATGLVVVGDIIGEGMAEAGAVFGETPNLAARLQTLAALNSVVISNDTRQLTKALFDYEDLGTHTLKGFKVPIQAWRALNVKSQESRFEAVRGQMTTPLVGRDQELNLLLDRWADAKNNQGQAVLLMGEPGIGKSRIIQSLKERATDDEYIRISYQCSPHFTHTTLYPIISQIEWVAGINRQDSVSQKLNKLRRAIVETDTPREQTLALLADMLSISATDHVAPLNMNPKQQRERTLEILLDQVRGMTAKAPVMVIFEDVHWADPTSLELLARAIERLPGLSMLLVMTSRPGFEPPWSGDQMTTLTLSRLSRAQCDEIVRSLVVNQELPEAMLQRMLDATDGVPLFVEEMTRAVLDSAANEVTIETGGFSKPRESIPIPATLRDSLMARLDRLGWVKEVAQMGAAIGREFSYELCWAIMPDMDEGKLQSALKEIVSSQLLFQRGEPRFSTYLFKHALVQEIAYSSMLQDKRRDLHATIARILEERFEDIAKERPEVLALHHAESGATDSAIDYLQRAGLQAAAQSANLEAIGHLKHALRLLETLPASETRDSKEMELLTMLAGAYISSSGYSKPELNETLTRAMQLADQVDDPMPLFPILHGRYMFLSVSGQTVKAYQLAEQLFNLSEPPAPDTARMAAHRIIGNSLFIMGDLTRARRHLDTAIAMYQPDTHAALAMQLGHDVRIASLSALAITTWLLGNTSQAIEYEQMAIDLAEEMKHANTLGYALAHGALLQGLIGNGEKHKQRSDALFAHASTHDLQVWLAASLFLRGWAVAEHGQLKEGIATMQQGAAALNANGVKYWRPTMLSRLAYYLVKAGDLNTASEYLQEARAVAIESQELWFTAECYRMQADLQMAAGNVSARELEKNYCTAIQMAQERGSKSFELRSGISMANFLSTQGRNDDAHELLTLIYDSFTPDPGNADLSTARTLIETLH